MTLLPLLLCCAFTLHSPKQSDARRPMSEGDARRAGLLAPRSPDIARVPTRFYDPPPMPPVPVVSDNVILKQTVSVDSGMAVIVPGPKNLLFSWNFPTASQTADMKFRLHTNANLKAPFPWLVSTNVPGSLRSAVVAAIASRQFYYLTASNYTGVSLPATK